MSNTEGIAELKSLILGLDGKVSGFSKQLDTIETKITNMSETISEVKAEVTSVKTDLKSTQHQLKCIKDSHEELERGVQAMDLQFSEHIESEAKKFSDYVESEGKKLELIKENIQLKIDKVREQQILLEKHDRKYNVLIYGLKEEKDEKINERIYDFMVNDLNIEKKRADNIPLANVHRIPSRDRSHRGPDTVIVRFIHFPDKQFFLSKGSNLAKKKIRMLDDLPVCMKACRHDLANIAYRIRTHERLQTRIRVVGTHLILQTRLNARDTWQKREEYAA